MNPSPQQELVIKSTAEGQDLVVLSVAGSGKTSTGVLALRPLASSKRCAALAFNKRNQEDLQLKMPATVLCRSFNAFGFRAWAQRVQGSCKVETKKNGQIRDSLNIHYDHWQKFNRVLSMLKSQGFVPPDPKLPAKSLIPWEWPEVREVLDDYDLWPEIDIPEHEIFGVLAEALRRSIAQAWEGKIDLDDQIYMPALWGGNFPNLEVMMIDEVQDVSPIQRKLIWQAAGGAYRQTQILALGDQHQAIYGFRGADFHSVRMFQEEFKCEASPLTVSFRCPQAVVAEAKHLVPEIEAHPSAPVGVVDWLTEHPEFLSGDVVLCRYNRPLIALAFSLIRRRIPAKVLGRDIGQSMLKLAKKMKCQRTYALLSELREYYKQEKTLLEAKGRFGSVQHLEDQCHSLAVLCKALGDVPVGELHSEIDRMFSDSLAPITLSTVHRAKGLEWPRVFFLDAHVIPSKFAKTDDEIQQEWNIKYVGITRAQRELYFIDSEEK